MKLTLLGLQVALRRSINVVKHEKLKKLRKKKSQLSNSRDSTQKHIFFLQK